MHAHPSTHSQRLQLLQAGRDICSPSSGCSRTVLHICKRDTDKLEQLQGRSVKLPKGTGPSDTRAGSEGAGLVCKGTRKLMRGTIQPLTCTTQMGVMWKVKPHCQMYSVKRQEGKDGGFVILRDFQKPVGYGPKHPDLTLRLVLLQADG